MLCYAKLLCASPSPLCPRCLSSPLTWERSHPSSWSAFCSHSWGLFVQIPTYQLYCVSTHHQLHLLCFCSSRLIHPEICRFSNTGFFNSTFLSLSLPLSWSRSSLLPSQVTAAFALVTGSSALSLPLQFILCNVAKIAGY